MTSRSMVYGRVSNYMLRAHGHDMVDKRKSANSAKVKFSELKRDSHEHGPVKMRELVSHYQKEQEMSVKAWLDGDSGPESEKLELSKAAVMVTRKAHEMGINAEELGASPQEICRNVEKTAELLCMGSCETPEKAVLGMVIRNNKLSDSLKILERINAGVESPVVENTAGILGEAERLGLEEKDMAVSGILNAASSENMHADSAIIGIIKESNCRTRALEIMTSKIVMMASEKQLEMFRRYIKVYEAAEDEHLERLRSAVGQRVA